MTMEQDPLTYEVARALNDRFDGVPGTVRIIDEMLDPHLGDSGMDVVYGALDELEVRWRAAHPELEGEGP